MSFLPSLLSLLLVVAGTVAVFAAIGRASVPARERAPLGRWGWRDVYGNVVQGLCVCSDDSPLVALMRKAPPEATDGPTDAPGRDQG